MKPWQYSPANDLDQSLVQRLRSFPREPDMLVYALRSAAALLLRGWLKLFHRMQIVGKENLPADGAFVIVANHTSHLDTLCLLSALPLRALHRTFPAAAGDYFFKSVPRTAFAAIVVNALPFDREVHVRQSLSLCRQLLQTPGNILVIFPEGTRSDDGRMKPFKPGVGLLVAGTDCPVVPCFLDGAHAAWPRGRWLPRPGRVRLTVGKPMTFASASRRKEEVRSICSRLEQAVASLKA